MRAVDHRAHCVQRRRRCLTTRRQFSQVRHPLRWAQPSLRHRRPRRSPRQRRRLRPRPPLHPAPSSCARPATFGLHRRAKPYASNLKARSYEYSAKLLVGGSRSVTPRPMAGCTAVWSSSAETASGCQEQYTGNPICAAARRMARPMVCCQSWRRSTVSGSLAPADPAAEMSGVPCDAKLRLNCHSVMARRTTRLLHCHAGLTPDAWRTRLGLVIDQIVPPNGRI